MELDQWSEVGASVWPLAVGTRAVEIGREGGEITAKRRDGCDRAQLGGSQAWLSSLGGA